MCYQIVLLPVMQSTQEIHLSALRNCYRVPLCSVSQLLELSQPGIPSSSSGGLVGKQAGCYRLDTFFFLSPKYQFSATSIFQGKAILVVNC